MRNFRSHGIPTPRQLHRQVHKRVRPGLPSDQADSRKIRQLRQLPAVVPMALLRRPPKSRSGDVSPSASWNAALKPVRLSRCWALLSSWGQTKSTPRGAWVGSGPAALVINALDHVQRGRNFVSSTSHKKIWGGFFMEGATVIHILGSWKSSRTPSSAFTATAAIALRAHPSSVVSACAPSAVPLHTVHGPPRHESSGSARPQIRAPSTPLGRPAPLWPPLEEPRLGSSTPCT
mmetsp:Transcript_37268/g.89625  ORF Transcript_37268/g.89625 Transcript_37268/m.89625 type:complete len:233 (+) Transcript_37268:463-1161(+)